MNGATGSGQSGQSALVGRVFEGLYPAANYRGIRPRLERRRFRVIEVRNLRERPLDPVTLELEPQLDRGQTLLKAWDLDKEAERQFYLERIVDIRPATDIDSPPADSRPSPSAATANPPNFPASTPPPADGDYQLWIVEQAEEFADRASLSPADFYTDDLDAAKTWAETFNDKELTSPVGAWAIIRRAPGMHQN